MSLGTLNEKELTAEQLSANDRRLFMASLAARLEAVGVSEETIQRVLAEAESRGEAWAFAICSTCGYSQHSPRSHIDQRCPNDDHPLLVVDGTVPNCDRVSEIAQKVREARRVYAAVLELIEEVS